MKRPRIGILKLTSCDGCQLSLLNMEDELFNLIELFDVAYFREASDKPLRGHFDIIIVEGSISTEWQIEDLVSIREKSRYLVTIGACATAGGIQALRNWTTLETFKRFVYPSPDMIKALSISTPISDHVHVDYELWGCPVNKDALSEVLSAFLIDKRPGVPGQSLCIECKARGIPCLLVSKSVPCLGPATRSGCGALCPAFARPCYGCFGPKEGANIESLLQLFQKNGLTQSECVLLLDKMNTLAYRQARVEE